MPQNTVFYLVNLTRKHTRTHTGCDLESPGRAQSEAPMSIERVTAPKKQLFISKMAHVASI